MKKKLLFSLVPVLLLLATSTDRPTILGHKMPLIANKTLDDKNIDEQYYLGHITLVSFMYVGCPPCMNEIGLLNKLKRNTNMMLGCKYCVLQGSKEGRWNNLTLMTLPSLASSAKPFTLIR